MTEAEAESERAALLRQAAMIRGGAALGKSAVLARLFDFLLQTALEERAPKEIEVADAVFGRGEEMASAQDASVRVYVHRLRRKLDDFYAGVGADERERLVLPRGGYRLGVASHRAVDASGTEPPLTGQDEEAALAPPAATSRGRRPRLLGALAALVVVLAALSVWLALRPDQADRDLAAVRASSLWASVVAPDHPIVVVLGDYYIFGESEGGGRVRRLVREFDVNSRYDLDEKVMRQPDLNGRYLDLGLRYYPLGVATALRDILPILRTAGRRVHQARVIPASELTPDMLRISNIVYIGYLSGLGALRDPVFNGSRYAVGDSYDELIDKRSGRSVTATTGAPGSGPQQDYGYVSRFAGPAGTSIVVIAGTRDAAVMQAADMAASRGGVEQIGARADGAAAFEALLRVDTLDNQNLSGRLLQVSPLATGAIWRTRTPQRFPDDGRTEPRGH